jgi:hypothetical protein
LLIFRAPRLLSLCWGLFFVDTMRIMQRDTNTKAQHRRTKGEPMAKATSPGAALAKLAQSREAIRAQTAALDAEEKTLRKALKRESAERVGAAFAGLDLGEVTKAQAAQLARAVQQHGVAETLARLAAK